ncbi:ATP-binding cassette domain-containing protein [Thiohalorhabdus sp. Cl-TMA]|uniref:ATP-binding cassette domain-containing protein n=1 Tax=Thiohalorhabdus methylotrophus TaxID=3242694 RepID=A0ABV4TQ57_9GAMM
MSGLLLEGVAQGPLQGVDLHLPAGQVGWLQGATGNGKSLLLYLAAGLILPERGRVLLDGAAPEPPRVAMAFQNPDYQLLASRTDADVALNARSPEGVERALEAAGCLPFRDRPPELLTPGQRRRAALAGVLAAEPVLALLDTPFAGMGAAEAARLWTECRPLLADRGSVVLITGEPPGAAVNDAIWEVEQWLRPTPDSASTNFP